MYVFRWWDVKMKWSDPDVEGLIQYMVNDKGFK